MGIHGKLLPLTEKHKAIYHLTNWLKYNLKLIVKKKRWKIYLFLACTCRFCFLFFFVKNVNVSLRSLCFVRSCISFPCFRWPTTKAKCGDARGSMKRSLLELYSLSPSFCTAPTTHTRARLVSESVRLCWVFQVLRWCNTSTEHLFVMSTKAQKRTTSRKTCSTQVSVNSVQYFCYVVEHTP